MFRFVFYIIQSIKLHYIDYIVNKYAFNISLANMLLLKEITIFTIYLLDLKKIIIIAKKINEMVNQ